MTLRVVQPVQSVRRGHREAQHHALARRRRQPVLRCIAMHMRAIGIRHDQACVGGKNLAGQILREGKEQPVAMRAILGPFLISPQILDR